MTTVIPEGLEPLATWDAKDRPPGWTDAHTRDLVTWAREHIGNPNVIYRAEFYLIDSPFAVVRRFAVNQDGRKYHDPATDSAATEPPVIVPLAELPPAHLLKG